MRFRSYESNDSRGVAVKDGTVWRDLGEIALVDLIQSQTAGDASIAEGKPEIDITSVKILPVIPRPPKFICVGLNYVDHLAESPYRDMPKYPAFFGRFSTSLIADGDPIIRPLDTDQLDFEAELAVIVGKTARRVSEDDALDYVAGYSIFNDGSLRDYQFISAQWTVGKNFDDTGAFGPEFVTADELPAGARGLGIETYLNGTLMQKGNTDDMIFSVAKIISIASQTMTLEPGDVIATGTPAGIGWARKPSVFMKDGDICEIRIDRIGVLRNEVRNEVRA